MRPLAAGRFGSRLRQARTAARLRQEEVGEACGWGAAQSRIANYETGKREPMLSDIVLLAGALGVSPSWLAFGESALSSDEADLLRAWRLADAGGRAAFRAVIGVSARAARPKSRHAG